MELSDLIFHDEDAAREHLEALRWPDGAYCPYCGSVNVKTLGGESMGRDWWYCADCQDKFTVRVGSIFERSHVPLHKWLLAFRLMASSKKGVSAHQLHRTLHVTYKTAWFMGHRIRECMKDPTIDRPLGGEGKVVEVDETFQGSAGYVFDNEKGWQKKRGRGDHRVVVALVERGGKARSLKVDDLTIGNVRKVVMENVARASQLHTDEAQHYRRIGRQFAGHEAVKHEIGEYVKPAEAGGIATTNTVEGFFSIFKRGMVGVYQHCGEQHLQRYLTEFDFRYSNRAKLGVNDELRTERAVKGAAGRRLTYKKSIGREASEAHDAR